MEEQHQNDPDPQMGEGSSLGPGGEQEQPTTDAIEVLERSRAFLQQLVALSPNSSSLDPAELIQQLRNLE